MILTLPLSPSCIKNEPQYSTSRSEKSTCQMKRLKPKVREAAWKYRVNPRITDTGAFSAQYVFAMSVHVVVRNHKHSCLLVPAGARVFMIPSFPHHPVTPTTERLYASGHQHSHALVTVRLASSGSVRGSERRLSSEEGSRDGSRGFLSPRDKRCGGLRRVAPP